MPQGVDLKDERPTSNEKTNIQYRSHNHPLAWFLFPTDNPQLTTHTLARLLLPNQGFANSEPAFGSLMFIKPSAAESMTGNNNALFPDLLPPTSKASRVCHGTTLCPNRV